MTAFSIKENNTSQKEETETIAKNMSFPFNSLHRAAFANLEPGQDPFNQNSNRSDREKWSTSKGAWTSFFETFPVGPNRSIEFWTEISGNFGLTYRARDFGFFCSVNHFSEGGVNANHNVTCSPNLAENDSRLDCSRIAKEIAMVIRFFVEGRRQTLLYSFK